MADNTATAHCGLEVQFFDVKSDHMIWTAKTKTFDAGDLDDLVIQFADIVIDDLIAKGVISDQRDDCLTRLKGRDIAGLSLVSINIAVSEYVRYWLSPDIPRLG